MKKQFSSSMPSLYFYMLTRNIRSLLLNLHHILDLKKITTDRNKLLVEAKTIYGKNIDLNANEEYATLLSIVILQIMGKCLTYYFIKLIIFNVILLGLEAHEMFIKNVAKGLYVYHTIETFMLPSTAPEMKKRATNIIGFLFDFKVE